MELFCQCTLLPYIVPFLTHILPSHSFLPPSDIPASSPPSTSDFFLELSHFLSTLFLSFFPVLARHASDQSSYFQTWQVSKLHLLTLCYTTAFPIFLSAIQLLQTQCHQYTTIKGIVSCCRSSFFLFLLSQHTLFDPYLIYTWHFPISSRLAAPTKMGNCYVNHFLFTFPKYTPPPSSSATPSKFGSISLKNHLSRVIRAGFCTSL